MTLGLLLPTLAGEESSVPAWVDPMTQVHARFTGRPGTFAMFGDSITVSLAFWAPLQQDPKNLSPAARQALERVTRHLHEPCWRDWRGPAFGSEGGQTMGWAAEHVDKWLAKLNPEVVLLMFGSNDVGREVTVDDFAAATKRVVERCLKNRSVVILTTLPPRSGHEAQCERFAEAGRRIAEELGLPLIDYHAEILRRRPRDWDGSKPPFNVVAGGHVYDVPTLISGDGVHPSAPQRYAGDFSDEALNCHGYNLRSYLTLLAYAEVIERVLAPGGNPGRQ